MQHHLENISKSFKIWQLCDSSLPQVHVQRYLLRSGQDWVVREEVYEVEVLWTGWFAMALGIIWLTMTIIELPCFFASITLHLFAAYAHMTHILQFLYVQYRIHERYHYDILSQSHDIEGCWSLFGEWWTEYPPGFVLRKNTVLVEDKLYPEVGWFSFAQEIRADPEGKAFYFFSSARVGSGTQEMDQNKEQSRVKHE